MAIIFDGDVVAITGAGRGLGRAHALLLAELGARVVVNDIGGATDGTGADGGAAEDVVTEIEALGGTAIANVDDGSTVVGAQALIDSAIGAYGRIDAVIANAGILRDRAFHNLTDEDFFAVLNVHLTGTFRVFHAAFPHMREQGYGRLVSTTSAAGLYGNFGQAAYATAKMGILGLTRTLAIEGAKRNIKANALAPIAETRMSEGLVGDWVGKLAPELVSPLAAYLCHSSLDASGQVVSAGGGRFGRVGVGVASGVYAARPDADFVADHFNELLRQDEMLFPVHASEELQFLAQHVTSANGN